MFLIFKFKIAHACMWIGALFNALTYADNGRQVLEKFINTLKLADLEEGYQGNEFVVSVLGERDVF